MDQLTLWEGAVFDAVIDECLSEASICHDEFQINKRVGLQVMLHGVYLRTGNRTEKEKRNRLGGRLFDAEARYLPGGDGVVQFVPWRANKRAVWKLISVFEWRYSWINSG